MKLVLSTKIDGDLLEIVDEICSKRGVTYSKFLNDAIKHYITSSSINGIPSLEQPDEQTKVYASTIEEQTNNQPQIQSGCGES